jgi:hypothetical protein
MKQRMENHHDANAIQNSRSSIPESESEELFVDYAEEDDVECAHTIKYLVEIPFVECAKFLDRVYHLLDCVEQLPTSLMHCRG